MRVNARTFMIFPGRARRVRNTYGHRSYERELPTRRGRCVVIVMAARGNQSPVRREGHGFGLGRLDDLRVEALPHETLAQFPQSGGVLVVE